MINPIKPNVGLWI